MRKPRKPRKPLRKESMRLSETRIEYVVDPMEVKVEEKEMELETPAPTFELGPSSSAPTPMHTQAKQQAIRRDLWHVKQLLKNAGFIDDDDDPKT
ncbi:unnamed protein product [Ilex paraguariensis]|uniref:Uncharacterized protein n=1 Tax=Ilex paraguariensis TaxID=185542 RepID=A0ABC8SGK3_9AQUA